MKKTRQSPTFKIVVGVVVVMAAVAVVLAGSIAARRNKSKPTPKAAFPVQALSGPQQQVPQPSQKITEATASNVVQVAKLGMNSGYSSAILLSPNRRFMAIESGTNGYTVVDSRTGKPTLWFDAGPIKAVALADDGKTAAVSDDQGQWLVQPKVVRQLVCPGYDPKVRALKNGSIALSADGRQVAIWGFEGKSCVFETSTLAISQRKRSASDDEPVAGYYVGANHVLYRTAPQQTPTLDAQDTNEYRVTGTNLTVPAPPITLSVATLSLDGNIVVGATASDVYVSRDAGAWTTFPLPPGRTGTPKIDLSGDGSRAVLQFEDPDTTSTGLVVVDVTNGRQLWSTNENVADITVGATHVVVVFDHITSGIEMRTGALSWTWPTMSPPFGDAIGDTINTRFSSVSLKSGITKAPVALTQWMPDFTALAGSTSVTSQSTEPGVVRISTEKARRTLNVGGRVTALAVRADEQELLVATGDGLVQRWDLTTDRISSAVPRINNGEGQIAIATALAYSAQGGYVVATREGWFEIFDTGGKRVVSQQFGRMIEAVALSPDGALLAIESVETEGVGREWHMKVVEVATTKVLVDIPVFTSTLAFSLDGSTVAFHNGSTLEQVTVKGSRASGIDLISQPLAIAGAAEGFSMYETNGLVEYVVPIRTAVTKVSIAHVEQWSGVAPRRFVSGPNGVVVEREVGRDPAVIRTFVRGGPVMSPDNELLLTSTVDRVIGFDPSTGLQRFSTAFPAPRVATEGFPDRAPGSADGIAFAPDGRHFATVGAGGGMILDTTGKVVRKLEVPGYGSSGKRSITYSPDAKLVVLSLGNALNIFTANTGTLLHTIPVGDEGHTWVKFAADQSWVATIDAGGIVREFAVVAS